MLNQEPKPAVQEADPHPAAEEKAAESGQVPSAEPKEDAAAVEKTLTLTIGERTVPVLWEENETVAELAEYAAPAEITVEMSMYGGWEQVGSLGRAFTRNDVQQTAQNGDIMLYSGSQIVLFYGPNTWAYTKLGHIDLPEEEVTALLSGGNITAVLSVEV